ncbi:hypothetical protein ACFWAY_07340 [Rhodococcus sp. NPDC059968]|uniref:hypothetical protein n=1 Tax=Rhodococcus sp. NPDC059968 TaxID=3347017 RepID=UPI003672BC85
MKTTALTTHLYAPSTDLWDWQMNATCRSMGTDLFFSPEGETRQARRYREDFATRICQEESSNPVDRGVSGDLGYRRVR